MKSFTSSVIAVASFLALVSAAPSQKARTVPYVDVTFHGATPEAVYTLSVPLDGYTEVYTRKYESDLLRFGS
jgi:acetate kinase